LNFSQPLRNIPRQTEEAIAISRIDGAISASGAGALNNPVLDCITEFLGRHIDGIADVAQLGQLDHDLQGLLAAVDPKDTLQADNAPDPRGQLHIVAVAAVVGLSGTERRPCRQACPRRH